MVVASPEQVKRIAIELICRFEPQSASVAAARRFIYTSLSDLDRIREVDVVVLLTSEVVTNAVVHAGPHAPGDEMVVTLRRAEDVIRVEVADGHPAVPGIGDGVMDGQSGRGLLLIDALASAWGVTKDGSGKVVWFEVRT